jgi:hypothetical protein
LVVNIDFFRNPLFEKWLGVQEKESTTDENGGNDSLAVPEQPENIKNLLAEVTKEFENLVKNPISIDLDLRNPFPNPRISMRIKTPKTAQLGNVIKLEYTFGFLEEGIASFVIQLDEEEESDMLVFLGKTINLIEFTEEVKEVKVVFEALVHHSGVYRIPDMIITDFKGEFSLFQTFWPFLADLSHFKPVLGMILT